MKQLDDSGAVRKDFGGRILSKGRMIIGKIRAVGLFPTLREIIGASVSALVVALAAAFFSGLLAWLGVFYFIDDRFWCDASQAGPVLDYVEVAVVDLSFVKAARISKPELNVKAALAVRSVRDPVTNTFTEDQELFLDHLWISYRGPKGGKTQLVKLVSLPVTGYLEFDNSRLGCTFRIDWTVVENPAEIPIFQMESLVDPLSEKSAPAIEAKRPGFLVVLLRAEPIGKNEGGCRF